MERYILPPGECHAAKNAREMTDYLRGIEMENAMTNYYYDWQPPRPEFVKCHKCGRTIPGLKATLYFNSYYCGKLGHYNPRVPNDKEFLT